MTGSRHNEFMLHELTKESKKKFDRDKPRWVRLLHLHCMTQIAVCKRRGGMVYDSVCFLLLYTNEQDCAGQPRCVESRKEITAEFGFGFLFLMLWASVCRKGRSGTD